MRRVRSIRFKFLTKSHKSERERKRERDQTWMWKGKSTSSHQDVEDNTDKTSSRLARVIDDDKEEKTGRNERRRKLKKKTKVRSGNIMSVWHECRFCATFSKSTTKGCFSNTRREWKSDCRYATKRTAREREREKGRATREVKKERQTASEGGDIRDKKWTDKTFQGFLLLPWM